MADTETVNAPNESVSGGDGSDRYAEWLEDAPEWLHEKAGIDDLSRREINALARKELTRRRNEKPIVDSAESIWAWLFVEFTLYSGDVA